MSYIWLIQLIFMLTKKKNENDIQAINGISLYDLEDNQLESMKPIHSLPIELTDQNLNPATDKESIFHLNTMLKSLILPQKNSYAYCNTYNARIIINFKSNCSNFKYNRRG